MTGAERRKMNRERCILDNGKVVEAMLDLRKELYRDFLETNLLQCEKCGKNLEEDFRRGLHQNLIELYNVLSEIKRKLKDLT